MNLYKFNLAKMVCQAQEGYRMRQGNRLLPSHDKALTDIGNCCSAALGGHRYKCADCEKNFWVYHSCGNRSCPACHSRDARAWLEKRKAQLLPCGYFHLIATVPQTTRRAFLADQKAMYGLFMKTVAQSVMDLAKDSRFVGGTPGILMVLHTWTGQLHYHPHVHLLVTAGGITDDGEHWCEPKSPNFLVSVKALSKMIRRRFGEALEKLNPEVYGSIPASTWSKGWNTFCKPYGKSGEAVLKYLSRYVFRIAITNARIENLEDGHITFRYKDRATNQQRHCRLDNYSFLDRFLQHVLPKGFHKVRYYGLWHHSKRSQQQALRLLVLKELGPQAAAPSETISAKMAGLVEIAELTSEAERLAAERDPIMRVTQFEPVCPYCGSREIIHLEDLKRPIVKSPTRPQGSGP